MKLSSTLLLRISKSMKLKTEESETGSIDDMQEQPSIAIHGAQSAGKVGRWSMVAQKLLVICLLYDAGIFMVVALVGQYDMGMLLPFSVLGRQLVACVSSALFHIPECILP
ncbi:hypothetical protein CK203_033964 [Vitis vinifera]|uniref:Uncharacterized protein n=1 Tax=Vitis vinifera TaxID=29760 RepID=A0A438HTZ2_VITVI|nr:hypothetical protein CK203_033964 [Vitis vinifera]